MLGDFFEYNGIILKHTKEKELSCVIKHNNQVNSRITRMY